VGPLDIDESPRSAAAETVEAPSGSGACGLLGAEILLLLVLRRRR